VFYPLCLCYCPQCSLVQLGYVIPTDQTFGGQYTYLTGSSGTLVKYYSRLAVQLVDRFSLQQGDIVIEIGSNDGTFLKAFQSLGMRVLGIEGAKHALEAATANGVPTLDRFFGKGIAAAIKDRLPKDGRVRLIVAMNVLAHTDNINDFLPEVVGLMEADTVFVSSSHWLVALVQKFEFDTIYHEHLRYYTLASLMQLFQRHRLSMVDAEITVFYGGSILGYAVKEANGHSERLLEKPISPPCQEGVRGSDVTPPSLPFARGGTFYTPSERLLSILEQERQVDIIGSLKRMKQVLLNNKARLIGLLVDLKRDGKRTVGIGAPMKASTLLNFYGVTSDLVEYLAEVNPLKVGTVVPGVRIPVVHEEILLRDPPDYAIVLSWNMAGDIIPKYRSLGYSGKFILPVPQLEVID
jgi:hypothetical protein